MKIFIWIATFFILTGIPNTIMYDLQVKYRALISFFFAIAALRISKFLCKKWDAHKTSKTNTENQTEEIATELPASAPDTSSDITTAVKVSAVAKRKKIASPEITETEIIPKNNTTELISENKPNKKKRILNKFTIAITALCILLCISIGANIYQAQKNIDFQNNINTLNKTIENKNDTIKIKQEQYDNMYDEWYERYKTVKFYEDYIVILPNDNSGTYHIYGCKDCNTSSFWIYTIDDAKAANYQSCNNCCSKIETSYKLRKYGIKAFFEGIK